MKKLYKRTSTGAIQEWSVEIEGNKFRTISGQTDGLKVTSDWTVCSGKNKGKKNETSDEEQAQLEAASKRQKKLDAGYFENLEDIDESKFFKPMLAKVYKDYEPVFPCYCQPKLDGIRMVIDKNSARTRNGKDIVSVPHIVEALRVVFKNYPEIVLDGELYNHAFKANFNEIASIVRKTKPTKEDLDYGAGHIQYWIYDFGHNSKTMSFALRLEILKNIEKLLRENKVPSYVVKIVETRRCEKQEDLDKLYARYLDYGFEGQMVRYDENYENKRSKFLLKRKEFMDEEFEILDVIEGVGNKSGMAGAMAFRTKNGKDFTSNIKADWATCQNYLLDKNNFIGKMATVKFFNWTPDGLPRFPYVIGIRDFE